MALKGFMARGERGIEAGRRCPGRCRRRRRHRARCRRRRVSTPRRSSRAGCAASRRCGSTAASRARWSARRRFWSARARGSSRASQPTRCRSRALVEGDIAARRKITLERTAVVIGDLTTPGIVIEEGAKLKGRIVIGSDAAETRRVGGRAGCEEGPGARRRRRPRRQAQRGVGAAAARRFRVTAAARSRRGGSNCYLADLLLLGWPPRASSSVGRASASQAEGRGFDPRLALQNSRALPRSCVGGAFAFRGRVGLRGRLGPSGCAGDAHEVRERLALPRGRAARARRCAASARDWRDRAARRPSARSCRPPARGSRTCAVHSGA